MLVQPEVMFFLIPPTQVTSNLKLSLYLSLLLFPVQPTLAVSSYLEVKVWSGASCLVAVHQQNISQPHIGWPEVLTFHPSVGSLSNLPSPPQWLFPCFPCLLSGVKMENRRKKKKAVKVKSSDMPKTETQPYYDKMLKKGILLTSWSCSPVCLRWIISILFKSLGIL